MGDAVLFWGTYPNGDIDPHSLHGGCPVKNGTKWWVARLAGVCVCVCVIQPLWHA